MYIAIIYITNFANIYTTKKKYNCLMLRNATCQHRKSFITREFPQNTFGKEKKKKQHITTSAPGPAFAVSQNSLFQSCP